MDRSGRSCVNLGIERDQPTAPARPDQDHQRDPAARRALDAETFVRQEWTAVVGAVTLRTGDPQLAEELAQEAFARAWANWDDVALLDHPVAWVHRVARNLANSHWRRLRTRRRLSSRLQPVAPVRPIDADHLAVRDAIDQLSDRQREIVILRYYAGLDVTATATVLGIAPSTVTTQTARAMQRLRRLLDEETEP